MVSRVKSTIERLKKSSFGRVMRMVGSLKGVEIWRRCDTWLELKQNKSFQDSGKVIKVGYGSITRRIVGIKRWFFEEWSYRQT